MSGRVRSLFHLCQSVCSFGHIRQCPHVSHLSRLSAEAFQSFRLKSSSFILGHSEVLLQDGIEIQEIPWVVRRLDPQEFPFVNSNTRDGRRYICGVKDEQFVQQLQECVTIHQACLILISLHICCKLSLSCMVLSLFVFLNFFKKVRVWKISGRASTLAACSQSGIRLIWKVKMKLRKSPGGNWCTCYLP